MAGRAQIEKLRRLAESNNPHEADLARTEADRLLAALIEPTPAGGASSPHPAYPNQLPAAIRVPTPIGGR